MPTMDDVIRLIQEAEAGRNDVVAKSQAVEAASAAAAAASQEVSRAVADRDHTVAAQSAKVGQVLAMINAIYGDPPPIAAG